MKIPRGSRNTMAVKISSIVLLFIFSFTYVLPDVFAVVGLPLAPYGMPGGDAADANFARVDVDTFTIPTHLGEVKYSFKGDSGNVVVHIQDAHCNSFAQHKIADLIGYLNKEYGIRMLNLEGGQGAYNLDVFTSITGEAIRREVADHFVKKGEISGAEFYAINNPEKVTLWGIEDRDLYIANLKIYRDSLKYKKEVDKYLNELTHILNNLKRHIYTDELLKIDMAYNAYKAGNMDFKDYVSFLIDKAKANVIDVKKLKNLYLLSQVREQEMEIDFKKANRERDVLVDELKNGLSKNEVRKLVSNTVAFKTKRMSRKAFYGYLLKKARELDVNTNRFPELTDYIVYVSLYDAIDQSLVMKEMDALEAEIKELLYRSDAQRTLNMLSRNLALMKNLFRITLTKADYEYYLENRDSFGVTGYLRFIEREAPKYKITARPSSTIFKLDEYRDSISEFYEYAFKRDEAFLRNMRYAPGSGGTRNAMVMTGGFHTENLCNRFREEGISYVSIIPRFTSAKDYESPYFNLLAGQKTDVQRMLRSVIAQLGQTSMIQIASRMSGLKDLYGDLDIFHLDVLAQEWVVRNNSGIKILTNDRSGALLDALGNETTFGNDRSEMTAMTALEFLTEVGYEMAEANIARIDQEIDPSDVGTLKPVGIQDENAKIIRDEVLNKIRSITSTYVDANARDMISEEIDEAYKLMHYDLGEHVVAAHFRDTAGRLVILINNNKTVEENAHKVLNPKGFTYLDVAEEGLKHEIREVFWEKRLGHKPLYIHTIASQETVEYMKQMSGNGMRNNLRGLTPHHYLQIVSMSGEDIEKTIAQNRSFHLRALTTASILLRGMVNAGQGEKTFTLSGAAEYNKNMKEAMVEELLDRAITGRENLMVSLEAKETGIALIRSLSRQMSEFNDQVIIPVEILDGGKFSGTLLAVKNAGILQSASALRERVRSFAKAISEIVDEDALVQAFLTARALLQEDRGNDIVYQDLPFIRMVIEKMVYNNWDRPAIIALKSRVAEVMRIELLNKYDAYLDLVQAAQQTVTTGIDGAAKHMGLDEDTGLRAREFLTDQKKQDFARLATNVTAEDISRDAPGEISAKIITADLEGSAMAYRFRDEDGNLIVVLEKEENIISMLEGFKGLGLIGYLPDEIMENISDYIHAEIRYHEKREEFWQNKINREAEMGLWRGISLPLNGASARLAHIIASAETTQFMITQFSGSVDLSVFNGFTPWHYLELARIDEEGREGKVWVEARDLHKSVLDSAASTGALLFSNRKPVADYEKKVKARIYEMSMTFDIRGTEDARTLYDSVWGYIRRGTAGSTDILDVPAVDSLVAELNLKDAGELEEAGLTPTDVSITLTRVEQWKNEVAALANKGAEILKSLPTDTDLAVMDSANLYKLAEDIISEIRAGVRRPDIMKTLVKVVNLYAGSVEAKDQTSVAYLKRQLGLTQNLLQPVTHKLPGTTAIESISPGRFNEIVSTAVQDSIREYNEAQNTEVREANELIDNLTTIPGEIASKITNVAGKDSFYIDAVRVVPVSYKNNGLGEQTEAVSSFDADNGILTILLNTDRNIAKDYLASKNQVAFAHLLRHEYLEANGIFDLQHSQIKVLETAENSYNALTVLNKMAMVHMTLKELQAIDVVHDGNNDPGWKFYDAVQKAIRNEQEVQVSQELVNVVQPGSEHKVFLEVLTPKQYDMEMKDVASVKSETSRVLRKKYGVDNIEHVFVKSGATGDEQGSFDVVFDEVIREGSRFNKDGNARFLAYLDKDDKNLTTIEAKIRAQVGNKLTGIIKEDISRVERKDTVLHAILGVGLINYKNLISTDGYDRSRASDLLSKIKGLLGVMVSNPAVIAAMNAESLNDLLNGVLIIKIKPYDYGEIKEFYESRQAVLRAL